MNTRTLAALPALALALALTACTGSSHSSTIGEPAPQAPASPQPAATAAPGGGLPQPAPSQNPNAISFSADRMLLDALEALPASYHGNDLTVVIADLDRAAAAAGLPRSPDADQTATWWSALGNPFMLDDFSAPVLIPIVDRLVPDPLGDYTSAVQGFQDEFGWNHAQIRQFASSEIKADGFTLVTGEFTEGSLSPQLTRLDDSVVSAGDGENGERVSDQRTPARPDGIPLRMSVRDGAIGMSERSQDVAAWHLGDVESLADTGELVPIAEALQSVDPITATLTVVTPHTISRADDATRALLPAEPWLAAGVGWGVDDGSSVIGIAVEFATAEEAAQYAGDAAELFRVGVTREDERLADQFDLETATATGTVALLKLTPTEPRHAVTIEFALLLSDLPFAVQ